MSNERFRLAGAQMSFQTKGTNILLLSLLFIHDGKIITFSVVLLWEKQTGMTVKIRVIILHISIKMLVKTFRPHSKIRPP